MVFFRDIRAIRARLHCGDDHCFSGRSSVERFDGVLCRYIGVNPKV